MFGYIRPVHKELLVKEDEFYKATYCGVCRAMKANTGALSNITLTYDSVFLALVRMAYIPDGELGASMRRCIAHPMKRKCMLNVNSATEYTARAMAILCHYKLLDDLKDRDSGHRAFVRVAKPVTGSARRRAALPELEASVAQGLEEISALEREGCPDPDRPATLFGKLLGQVFSYGLDGEARLVTQRVGYHLGRFIYCADAAEDYDKDRRSGSYNPYVLSYRGAELTEQNRQTIKCGLLLECEALEGAINLVPFANKITAENIVRNIIYLGLPNRISFLDGDRTKQDQAKGNIL